MEARIVETQRALLDWFEQEQRDLPWRNTRDPWAILVSELMLQQTQVSRVLERWPQFLHAFPTPAACAAAPTGDIVRAWQGLGYNRRALYLHKCATAIVELHDGVFPRELTALQALPGIGAYTARAVAAFAFEQDYGVVDTNAARVLARCFAGISMNAKGVQLLADSVVPVDTGWRWNQAMLDLGARICKKRLPACDACPLRAHCSWATEGFTAVDPAIGTAGVSGPQSKFVGSDRQGRGRLIDALRLAAVPTAELATAMGWPQDHDRAARVAATLVADGLVVNADGMYRLP